MEKIHLTLLDESQISGDNRLEVIKKYGPEATITDFGVLMGGLRSSFFNGKTPKAEKDYTMAYIEVLKRYGNEATISDFGALTRGLSSSHFNDKSSSTEKNYTVAYWLKNNHGAVLPVFYSGISKSFLRIQDKDVGIRPVLHLQPKELRNLPSLIDEDQMPIFFFGEYPNTLSSFDISKALEEKYSHQNLETTGKTYTLPKVMDKSQVLEECIFEGQKYIRIEPSLVLDNSFVFLDKPCWVKVTPIPWLYDEKSELLISKHCLVAGLPYARGKANTFEETNIYNFLNNYLAQELISSSEPLKTSILDKDFELRKLMLKKR